MTATKQAPDTKPDTPPTPAGPSVKSVAFSSAATVTVLGTTVAFVVAGPLGLVIAAGAVTIGGVTVARAIKPRARKTTPGLLHALIGRPRRTTTARTGAEWARSLTRTRRGRSKTSMSPSGPIGRRTGRARLGLPQLPALTAKGRAKRAAAAAATPHRKPTSKGSAPRAAANRPGTKPAGLKAPGTGSRTPARAGAARKLATAPGRTRAPQAGGRGPVRSRLTPTSRRTSTPGATSGRSGVRRTGARGGIRVPGAGMKTGMRSGLGRSVPRPGRPSSTGRTRPLPTLRHRKPVASSRVADRAIRGPKAATGRARRLGDMSTPVRRVDHRRALKAAPPNRTRTRPIPYAKTPARKLVQTAMRLPKLDGYKLTRPTPVQQRKARRTLVLRTKVAGRRTALKAAKSPVTAAKAAWLHRPLWAYPRIPAVPDPAWQIPTIPEPKAKAAPGPKTTAPKNDAPKTRRHRTEYPQKTARRATTPGGTTMSSSPVQAAVESASMIGGYTAQGATEYLAFLNQQPEIMQAYGQAYRLHAQRMTTDMPFSASAAAKMADLGAAMLAVEKIAAELGPALRAGNAEHFDALENRRPGLEMFNPERN